MARIIEDYRLEGPTRQEAMRSLERVMGPSEALTTWQQACTAVGVSPQREQLSATEFLAVSERLSQAGGLASIVGNSLWIRAQTWELLSRRQAASARQAGVK